MAEINNTVPSIVRGSSLYEAMCEVAKIANKAIGDADTANKGVAEAKAAAAAAQQTANQSHEEAINAAASAEQAGEKAQAAQTTADGAQTAADKAQTAADKAQATATGAVSKNTQQDARIGDIETGKTVIPTYFKTTAQGNAIPGMNGAGTQAVYYWATGSIDGDLPLRRHGQSDISKGGILVPQKPTNANEATSKHYIDGEITAVKSLINDARTNISQLGGAIQADESAAAVEQIIITSITLSGFSNEPNTKLRVINITGMVASDFSQNTSKKFTFSLENVLPDEKAPAQIGLTFFDTGYNDKHSRAALCAFSNKSSGEPILTIDFNDIDPTGGNSYEVFGTAIFTFTT